MLVTVALEILENVALDAAAYRSGLRCPEEDQADAATVVAIGQIAAKVVVNHIPPSRIDRLEDVVDAVPCP